jgi:flagellar hook-associated protein 2
MSTPISSAPSPVTLSGFNNIDFGSIVTAIMAQARQPETTMQTKQQNLLGQSARFSTLSTKLAALDSAASALATPISLSGTTVTSTDASAVGFTAGASTPLGTYDIKVQSLAHAQVTQSSAAPDAGSTIVASGGTLTIGGVDVTLSGDTTLQGLADAINGTANIGASASVVRSSANSYSLVLTGKSTGVGSGFAISNGLTGGSGVTFGANAIEASDAQITVNTVTVTSASNTFSNAVPGATINVFQADPAKTVSVTVNQSTSSGEDLIASFVSAYNDLVAFSQGEATAANHNDPSSIGHDSVLRTVNATLQQVLGGANGADSTFQYLSAVGVGFTQTGQLTFNSAAFQDAVNTGGLAHVQALLSGTTATAGVFQTVHDSISSFTASDGLVTSAQLTDTQEAQRLGDQISAFEARLRIQQLALQKEFSAADQAMATLNSQASSLNSLGRQYGLF